MICALFILQIAEMFPVFLLDLFFKGAEPIKLYVTLDIDRILILVLVRFYLLLRFNSRFSSDVFCTFFTLGLVYDRRQHYSLLYYFLRCFINKFVFTLIPTIICIIVL